MSKFCHYSSTLPNKLLVLSLIHKYNYNYEYNYFLLFYYYYCLFLFIFLGENSSIFSVVSLLFYYCSSQTFANSHLLRRQI